MKRETPRLFLSISLFLFHMIREIPCATISKLDHDLIKIVYKDEYQVELEDAKMVDDVFQELSGDEPVRVIMNTSGRYSVFSSEAQNYFSKEGKMVLKNKILAFATVINSLPNRLLVRFYLTFFRPPYPFEVFKNEEEALNYLNSLTNKKSDEVA